MFAWLCSPKGWARYIRFCHVFSCAGKCWVVSVFAVCVGLPAQAVPLEELFEAEQYQEFLAQAQTAAQAHDADALFLLGKAYHLGRGVEKDIIAARSYYRQADALDSARAAHNLGALALSKGRKSEAIAHFKRALSRGLKRPTLVNLAKAYTPTPVTDVRQAPHALWLYRLAADAYAQAWELDPSPALANDASGMYLQAYLIARAVSANDVAPFLQSRLNEEAVADLSLESFQMPVLRQATMTWLEKGMAENNSVSWTNYGVLLYEEKAFSKAQQAFERGAELNHALAYYYLGMIAERAVGAEADVDATARYFEHSLRLGEERARAKAIRWVRETLLHEKNTIALERGIKRLEALAEPGTDPASKFRVRLQWARHFVELQERARPLPGIPLYLRACGLDKVHGDAFNLGRNTPWFLQAYQGVLDWPIELGKSMHGRVDEQGCAVSEAAMPDEVRALLEKGAQLALMVSDYILPLAVRQEQDDLVLDIAEPATQMPWFPL